MKLSANGWSHLGLRVTDLARAKRFYVDTLGCPLVRETEQAVFVTVSGMLIALLGADAHTPGEDHFDPFRVGLDHLALAVENPSKLEDMQRDLDAAGVRNNGVEEDPVTHRKYISFYDPDVSLLCTLQLACYHLVAQSVVGSSHVMRNEINLSRRRTLASPCEDTALVASLGFRLQ